MYEEWDKVAEIRHQQIESGIDLTFCEIFLPYFENIVAKINPLSILEIGCGTGHLSERLFTENRKFVAVDPSRKMCSLASKVLKNKSVKVINDSIENYRTIEKYDFILSHMCAQTVSNIDTFFLSASRLLAKKATFIFSIPHPCFYNNYKNIFEERDYNYMEPKSKSITLTITKDANQPMDGIRYNHRPLSYYIKKLNSAGMSVIDMDEIFPPREVQLLYGKIWNEPRYLVIHATTTEDNSGDD